MRRIAANPSAFRMAVGVFILRDEVVEGGLRPAHGEPLYLLAQPVTLLVGQCFTYPRPAVELLKDLKRVVVEVVRT